MSLLSVAGELGSRRAQPVGGPRLPPCRRVQPVLYERAREESLGPCRVGEPCPAPLRVAMRSPLPFPCVPDRPYKILLVQVGTLSFSHPLFGLPVLFIYYGSSGVPVLVPVRASPVPSVGQAY